MQKVREVKPPEIDPDYYEGIAGTVQKWAVELEKAKKEHRPPNRELSKFNEVLNW